MGALLLTMQDIDQSDERDPEMLVGKEAFLAALQQEATQHAAHTRYSNTSSLPPLPHTPTLPRTQTSSVCPHSHTPTPSPLSTLRLSSLTLSL